MITFNFYLEEKRSHYFTLKFDDEVYDDSHKSKQLYMELDPLHMNHMVKLNAKFFTPSPSQIQKFNQHFNFKFDGDSDGGYGSDSDSLGAQKLYCSFNLQMDLILIDQK